MRRRWSTKQCVWLGPRGHPCSGSRQRLANANPDSIGKCNGDDNCDADGNRNGYSYCNGYSNSYAHTDSYTHGHSNSYAYTLTYANRNS
jgi:hypothetical protein